MLALHRLTVRAADLRAVELPTEMGESAGLLVLSWRVAAEYGSLPQAARLRADLVRALDGSWTSGPGSPNVRRPIHDGAG